MTWLKHLRRLTDCVSAGKLAVDAAISTSALPTGAATQTTSAAILAKMPAAPATEGKQDALIAKFPDKVSDHVPVVMASEADIATMQDDIALIKSVAEALATNQGDGYRDIGSPVRITHNSTSQSVAVPAGAKAVVCMSEGGATRCEIGGAASATSTIYVAEEASLAYPVTGGSQTLFAYGTAGYGNFRFLG